MSVALEWNDVPVAVTVPSRPQLTLVPPQRIEAPRVHLGRLTRRGRLARTLLVFTALMVAVLWRVAPLGAQADLTVDHSVTVQSGQSLSDVATHELAGLPVDEGVRRIRLVNDLSGPAIHAGQTLRIPVAQ